MYNGRLAPHIEKICRERPDLIGTNTDARLDMAHLMQQKVKGKARYKLQYMLDTELTDKEKYPLRLSDLIVMDLDAVKAPTHIEYTSEKKNTLYNIKHSGFRGDYIYSPRYISDDRVPYEGIAMFIDPSGRGVDETAYSITAHLSGKIFVLALGGVEGGYDRDVLIKLANLAKDYKCNVVQIESNFGDGSFAELLKPILAEVGHRCMVEDSRATTQKETRIIDTLEPIMMQHRLVMDKQIFMHDMEKKGAYKFTYQLTHITKDRGSLEHDDILDVLELSVKYWQETMARDMNDERAKHKEAKLDKELADFMEEFGITTKSNNVMDNY